MGEANMDMLRQLAPKWTLAGDDTLLTLLQNTHQKIVSKCQEVNTKLEEMVSSLDDASIHLQNVNNKFMSLSNRQFIESRVFDDDADITTAVQTNKESPPTELPDEISMLKNSLAILDSAHEITEIMDDSDSDSDNEISVVLKAKDMYSNRPLPHIVGSQQWKNKWHAGLIIEDSDSESLHSKDNTDTEYSDTDIEEHTDRQIDNTISESSSLHSDRLQSDRVQESNPHTAAQIAANIASVMAQTQPIIERPITPKEYAHISKKPPAVYKPTQPIISTVFLDEPPPLDQYDSDSSEHDVFAEINKINKNKIINTNNNNNIADDLFGSNRPYDEGNRVQDTEELFDSYDEPVKQKTTVIERQLETESKAKEKPGPKEDGNITKKPIGSVSLFGSNQNTDTIGAAILKRNLRHSSNSDESGSEEVKTKTFKPKTDVKQNVVVKKDIVKHETENNQNIDELDNKVTPKKDIYEDLFSKKDKIIKKEEETFTNEIKKNEVNIFSDNIFDDVDDIFSSNVKVTSKTSKSLFDSDDDLFSDIAKPKSIQPETSSKEKSKIVDKIFESEDELFSDLKTTPNKKVSKEKSTKTDTKLEVGKGSTNRKNINPSESKLTQIKKETLIENPTLINENKWTKTENIVKSKSIFDSDSDDDIFNFSKTTTQNSAQNLKRSDKKFQNPSLFDDEDDDGVSNNTQNNNKVPINKHEFNNDAKQDKLGSITKTIESKSQHQNTVPIQSKAIQKEALKSNEKLSKLEKQSVIDKIQEDNILVKEKSTLSLKEDNEDNNQNGTSKSEIMKSSGEAKEALKPDTDDTIFNEALVKDEQSLNEHLAKENQNLIKEHENMFKKTANVTKETIENDLFNEDLFKNESNKNENLPEVPIFNKSEQKTDDSYNTEENRKEDLYKEKKTLVTTDPPTPNENIKQIDKDLPTSNVNLPPIHKSLNIPNDNLPQVDKDHITPNENNPPSSIIPENEYIPQVPKTPDVPPLFDDILAEPPIFEKAKEPKKSKNVNALFDDDSEDEALFFKKNEVISDVKPEVFGQTVNFGLFADEPPAIDFENDLFSNNYGKDTKFTKNDSSQSKSDESDDGLLSKSKIKSIKSDPIQNTDPKIKYDEKHNKSDNFDKISQDSKLASPNTVNPNFLKDNVFHDSSDEEIFTEKLPILPEKSNLDKNITELETKSIFDDLDDNLFMNKKTVDTNIFNQESTKKTTEDIKKIGKLNTQNIIINVQALMPGASPKKVKIESQTIEVEPKRNDISELNVPEKPEPKISEMSKPTMVKSISFEDSPDTDVLDNNASKKRAKIQVKRRPSSRKARHEAARKSFVDTGKVLDSDKDGLDTTKISLDTDKRHFDTFKGSLDAETIVDKKEQRNRMRYKEDLDTNEELSAKDKESLDIDKQILDNEKTFLDTETTDHKERHKPVTKLENTENESVVNENKFQEKSTKIVYVLNDEDIFQTKKDLVESTKKEPTKSLFGGDKIDSIENSTETESTKRSLFNDQNDLAETTQTKNESTVKESTKKEPTIISLFEDQDEGETSTKTKNPTQNEKTKPKISLFDSDEEDEKSLFKTKPMVKKTKLFDSDSSDEDLFGSTKTKNLKKDTVMKKSLFDDENEEIFGANSDKIDKKSTTKTAKESSKKTIFNDPLTLFGDDDDD